MGGMTKSEVQRIIRHLVAQGCTRVDVKEGVRLLHPSGKGTVILHWTTSDYRALANTRAEVKRLGLKWIDEPLERKEERVNDSTIQLDELEKILAAVKQAKDLFTAQEIASKTGISPQRVFKALPLIGCERDGSYWAPPDDRPAMPEQPKPKQTTPPTAPPAPPVGVDTIQRGAGLPTPPKPQPAPAPRVQIREFVDPRNSWTIPTPATLQKYADEMGLNIEVRVWRGDATVKGG